MLAYGAVVAACAALLGATSSSGADDGPGSPPPMQPSAGGPDHDGDGVASAVDALPFLDTDSADADGDGYGDSQDRHPDDPLRAVEVELIANGGVDVDAAGWTPAGGPGAAHAPGAGRGVGGALRLTVPHEGDEVAWSAETVALASAGAVLHVEGALRGVARVELRLHVRRRDPMGTSTVTRTVALDPVAVAAGDGWRDYAVDVELPSRPVSVRLELAASGAPGGGVLLDDTSLTVQVAGDADGDGIDDRMDPDDDGDGYLDGEDPAPLDAEVGPVLARIADP